MVIVILRILNKNLLADQKISVICEVVLYLTKCQLAKVYIFFIFEV